MLTFHIWIWVLIHLKIWSRIRIHLKGWIRILEEGQAPLDYRYLFTTVQYTVGRN
jgi:hypothetical protein